jgi:hypothetical protein
MDSGSREGGVQSGETPQRRKWGTEGWDLHILSELRLEQSLERQGECGEWVIKRVQLVYASRAACAIQGITERSRDEASFIWTSRIFSSLSTVQLFIRTYGTTASHI